MEKDRVLPFLGHRVLDLDPFNIIDNKHMAIEYPFLKGPMTPSNTHAGYLAKCETVCVNQNLKTRR
ncbi:hypothetical protein [Flagellimonas pacifica]|uniref:Uncharacterized protein n=1 Tax=Flagellimonas pacifica TaxID=1247520 RepID=A0A285MVV9_9FLAO|nr:hypothetical protein [Allomuricauda parva]SNZ01329.1 hypothetical protein SAMN06265377_3167 [Allomuricauda parva]